MVTCSCTGKHIAEVLIEVFDATIQRLWAPQPLILADINETIGTSAVDPCGHKRGLKPPGRLPYPEAIAKQGDEILNKKTHQDDRL